MRVHKTMIFPVPVDLRTIVEGVTPKQQAAIEKHTGEIMSRWTLLGLRSADKVVAFKVKGPSHYLNPRQLGTQWMVRGPHGRGLLSLLGDLCSLVAYPLVVNYLDNIRTFLKSYPLIDEQAEGRVTYYLSAFISGRSNTLGKMLCILQSKKILSKWGFPTLGRLAHFDDFGGKKRYIALGNWMVQGVLRPLHDILIAYIRTLRPDATYDQSKVFR